MNEDNKRTPRDRIDNDVDKAMLKESGSNNIMFVWPGIFLFVDYLVISLGGWLYWLVISKFASVAEIGLATTVYSLIVLVSFLTQLGMEYPLLKRSRNDGDRALSAALHIEIIFAIASLPIIFLVTNYLYSGSIQNFMWIGGTLLLVLSIEFVFRFYLLGISDSKKVLITDMIGLLIKFLAGYSLTSLGYGAYGILIAYLLEVIFIVSVYFLFIGKKLSFRTASLSYIIGLFRASLINAPSKYSGQIIFNLSVVMLAAFGLSSFNVGLFYIALIISVFIGSFASSMAFMVIPASSSSKRDLSSESLRISLGLTSPIIVIMLVSPNLILSLIGLQYEAAAPIMFVLAFGIVPYAITVNVISKLNNLNKSKNLLFLGFTQMLMFLISFVFLVPHSGTIGAAYSILISFISSSILAITWLPRSSLRHIAVCCLAIMIGTGIGLGLSSITYDKLIFSSPIMLFVAVITCIAIILVFRIISITEVAALLKGTFQKG